MSNTTKTGYEIRSEILGMAIGILEDRANRQWDNEHLKPEGSRKAVNPFATEDVLVVAEKLLTFVNKK